MGRKLKTTQIVHHGGTENTEELVTDLAANLIQRTNHGMLVCSVPSVSPW